MLFLGWEEVVLALVLLVVVGGGGGGGGHRRVGRESLVWTGFYGRRGRGSVLRSGWDLSCAGMAVQKYCGLWRTVRSVLSTDARATLGRWLTRN